MMQAGATALRGYVRSFFRPLDRSTPSKWCEDNIRLPQGKQESEPGKVNFDKRPFLREPIDCFAEPGITDIVFCGPTRIGKTFFLRMGFAWSIAGDPAPTMWVDSTEDKAKDVSKKELQPMIAANAVLRDRKPKNRHNFTDLRMLFPAASFTMVGGNSDAQVAGDTVKRVFGNELDKWRAASEKEASIAELVRHRTESFEDDRRHAWSSTPTLEELTTWQYALRGDQRKWECICQRCSVGQFLEWENVKWDQHAKKASGKWDLAAVKASARYSCKNVSCTAHDPDGTRGTGWTEDERLAAIQDKRAQWIPTAIGAPGWRSYLINGLYGPLKTNSCGQLAVDFLSARNTGFFSDRQDFWNSRMGLPWRDDISLVTVEKFAARECPPAPLEPYLRGDIPKGWRPSLFVVGFDVQANRLPFVVRAFDWSGRSFLVDHGEVSHWKDLEQVQEDYRKLGCASYVIGDINYEERRAETLEQIYLRKDRGWFGAEAFEQAKELVRLEEANVYAGGRLAGKTEADGHKVTKLVISAYEFKVELEKRFTGEIPNWFCYQLPIASTEQEAEEQAAYYKQLLDERRRPRKKRLVGKPPFEWYSKNKYNHAFDCEVYILALFWTLQKRRSAAARAGAAAASRGEREVVEVRR
jgi:phage terminase large subunit GpA-like protein